MTTVPRQLVNRETDGSLLALPERRTFHIDLTFPELPKAHRRVVISHLPASGIKLAAVRALEIALERDEHILGRRPRRLVLIVDANSFEYDENGEKLPQPAYDLLEPRLDPAITKLLRAWARCRLTSREYSVLIAILHQTHGGTKPVPLPLKVLATATSLLPPHCSATLSRLALKRMVVVDQAKRPYAISLAIDPSKWDITDSGNSHLPKQT